VAGLIPLFDTNILIDYLKRMPEAEAEIDRYTEIIISVISWIEVMVGCPPARRAEFEAFLGDFHRIELDEAIMRRTVEVRRATKMKLPDAIIYASALVRGQLFVTRDVKHLPEGATGVRVPYTF